LRITFVLPPIALSGGWRVIAIYADRLQQRGHEVTLVSTPPAIPGMLGKVKSLARGRGWPKKVESEPSHFNITVPHHVIDRARPITDGDVPDADVVIATWWTTAEWVAALSPRKGAKAYFIQHYEVFDYLHAERVKATWRLPLQKITISKWLVELASREYGDHKVCLVPNSVEMDQFHAPPRGRQERPTVGLLYSPVKFKGVDVSLAALERVRRRIKNVRVIAFGAVRATPELPLPEWVLFHYRPPQDEIPRLYRQCDVWLCGSYSEGFHLPPLEAMACRCPVVSTRVGGPMDIVEEGINGFLVDVEDSIGLADRVVRVLTFSEPEWRRMSDAALATAARYTWDDATDLLESALHGLVGAVSDGIPVPLASSDICS
jgi:glycosyltransferase involved in cell wall biosynthesis